MNPFLQGKGEDKQDLITRVQTLETDAIHPEIAAMAKEILSKYNLEDVKKSAGEIEKIYTWSVELIGKLEKYGKVAKLPEEPADPEKRLNFRIKRQKFLKDNDIDEFKL